MTKQDAAPHHRWVPFLGWIGSYDRSWLSADLLAGIAVLALVVPESLAYAGVAGVPVQYGLYAIPFGVLGYVVFGSSRRLFVGPSSTVAALSAATLADAATSGANPIVVTAVITLLVGVLYLVLGILRMGFVARFFARPVLNGFILGLGWYIAIGQLAKLVGISKPVGNSIQQLAGVIRDLPDWSWATTAVGVLSLVALVLLERFAPKVPGVVVVVIVAIVASAALDLASHGVAIVGEIPTGFTFASWTGIDADLIYSLLPGVLGIIIVGFAQSVAIAKSYATKYGEQVDPNQELLAYGAANLGAGALQGITVTGSLSKSAAAEGAGAKSPIAFAIVSATSVITILFLAGLFENLPEATLAAVVINAVMGMLNPSKVVRLWRAHVMDVWLALGAFAGVVLIDILPGIVTGVALSLILFLHRLDHPQLVTLGRSPDKTLFDRLDTNPTYETISSVQVLRHDAPLIFSNADAFVDGMRLQLEGAASSTDVVLDLEAAFEVDISGYDALVQARSLVRANDGRFILARAGAEVIGFLERAADSDQIDRFEVQPTIATAIDALQASRS